MLNNIKVMIVRNFMAYLLNYTKKLAEKIQYYDAMIDVTDESHWMNPFYSQPEVTVIWLDNNNEN